MGAKNRYVYGFDEPSDGGRELLGGKGIGLAEMTALGVPVPSGFTITTDACRAYMANGKHLPEGLEDVRFYDPGDTEPELRERLERARRARGRE